MPTDKLKRTIKEALKGGAMKDLGEKSEPKRQTFVLSRAFGRTGFYFGGTLSSTLDAEKLTSEEQRRRFEVAHAG